MNAEHNEVHRETDAARAGSTPHIVRWVLGISLFSAIVLLSIIWMTGAATQSAEEGSVSYPAESESRGDTTDSIVDEGFDEIEAAEPTNRPPSAPPVVEN